jgi:4-hydroxy-tetrahydrodipicolinate reductase
LRYNAPSLAEVRIPQSAVPLSRLDGPVEARGAEVAGSRIHSVRLPSFVLTTDIAFAGAGERLVMRHDPGESPDPYVDGTLLPSGGPPTSPAYAEDWTHS